VIILKGCAVIAVGVIAGCYLDGSLVLIPAQRRLSAAAYIEVEQANTALGTIRYRPLLAITVFIQILLLSVGRRPASPLFLLTLLTLLTLLLQIGATALITVRQVVPINAAVHRWDPHAPARDWDRVRDRWHHLHHRRTALVTIAMLAQVAVTLSH